MADPSFDQLTSHEFHFHSGSGSPKPEDQRHTSCNMVPNLISPSSSPSTQPLISLSETCRLVCEASFDPVLVCSEIKVWGCNARLVEILGYSTENQILNLPTAQILERHFFPATVLEDGCAKPAGVKDVCRAYVGPPGPTQKLLTVRAKQWKIDIGAPLYTLSIQDVPLVKIANDTSLSSIEELAPHPLGLPNTRRPGSSNIPCSPLSTLSNNGAHNSTEIGKTSVSDHLVQEMSQIFDSLPCLVWYISPTGELTYMNKLYKEVLGIDSLHENFSVSVHSEDNEKMLPRWRTCIKTLSPFSMDVRLRYHPDKPLPSCRDREYHWFSLSSVPMLNQTDGSLQKWICSALDINDLKSAQTEKTKFQASEKAAKDASRLKSDFLAMMSHEIRTPLFGVVGNTCLMKETMLNQEQKELVDSIELSGKLLMTVIQDVLDFSRIESGRLLIQRSSFKLETLTKHIGQMLKTEATKKGIELKVSHSDYSGNIIGDSGRLLQVLTNLTSNAIKFTPRGSVHLSAQLHISTRSDLPKDSGLSQATLAVRVTDTGIGISAESIPTLFTPWTQADIAQRRYYGGSGLGLSICKSLVTLMNGKIGLESKLGFGTTAWFWVPLELEKGTEPGPLDLPTSTIVFSVSKDPVNPHSKPHPLAVRCLKRKSQSVQPPLDSPPCRYRILVAEDNPVNQAILGRFLDKMGGIAYKMLSDGQLTLDTYQKMGRGFYDIILLDQSLPGMNGDEVCRRIRNIDTDQILISVSADVRLGDQVQFLGSGMNDHLSKPVTYERFQQVLLIWLERGFALRCQNGLS